MKALILVALLFGSVAHAENKICDGDLWDTDFCQRANAPNFDGESETIVCHHVMYELPQRLDLALFDAWDNGRLSDKETCAVVEAFGHNLGPMTEDEGI